MANMEKKVLKERYRIDESLGRGGMAEVYKAYDQKRAGNVAIKILREDLARDKIFVRRFEREAKTLAQLQHRNIVRFYGMERDGLDVFIVMDFIEGKSLRDLIFEEGDPLPMSQVLEILEPICSALYYAHEMGIAHCDIKPSNIMLAKNGDVMVSDFGISRGMDAATSTMVGVGTPAYMAPELIRGEDPSPQSDIYSLGITLYEMLTAGERPFTGDLATITGTTAEKVRWEHLNGTVESPRKYNKEIPKYIEDTVLKCLEKEPRERFQSVQDLLTVVKRSAGSSNTSMHTQQSAGKLAIAEQITKQELINKESNEALVMDASAVSEKPKKSNLLKTLLFSATLIIVLLVLVVIQLLKDDFEIALIRKNNGIQNSAKAVIVEVETTNEQQQAGDVPMLIGEEMEPAAETDEVPNCVNEARLISETIPDGSLLKPYAVHQKKWVIENTGTCVWGEQYQLVLEDETPLILQNETIAMPRNVAPGEKVDVLLDFSVPDGIGQHVGYWNLTSGKDEEFLRVWIWIDNFPSECGVVASQKCGWWYARDWIQTHLR